MDTKITNIPKGLHKLEHQVGGIDEIDITDLSGVLADAQPAIAHAASHQNGGSDEPSVAGLSGELADDQPPKDHDAAKVTSGRLDNIARLPALTTGKIWAGVGGVPAEVDTPGGAAMEATVADFQVNAGTGTCETPQNANDNNTGTAITADVIGEYAEIDFGKMVAIKRWRMYGYGAGNADGTFKIEAYNLVTHAWEDWVTGIPTRAVASWTGLATEDVMIVDKVRITATTIDTGPGVYNITGEWEIYF